MGGGSPPPTPPPPPPAAMAATVANSATKGGGTPATGAKGMPVNNGVSSTPLGVANSLLGT